MFQFDDVITFRRLDNRAIEPPARCHSDGKTINVNQGDTRFNDVLLSDLYMVLEPLQSPSLHYNDVIMSTIASQITSLMIVYSTVYADADQRKHQSSASLAFVRGIHRKPVNSPHKWPVTRKMFPFDHVIMRDLRFGDIDQCPSQRRDALFVTSPIIGWYLAINRKWAQVSFEYACPYYGPCGLNQWVTTLQCNVVSCWLSPFSEWSLKYNWLWMFACKIFVCDFVFCVWVLWFCIWGACVGWIKWFAQNITYSPK